MAQTLGLRATSFVASTALLGLAVIAAMSVSITLQKIDFPEVPSVPMVRLDEPAPPPPQPRVRETPPQAPTEDQTFTEVVSTELPEAPSDDAIGGSVGPPGLREITNPRWLSRPRDLGVYYPRRALARGVTGAVVLDCLVGVSGALTCSVVSETPQNWGFAAAALRISRDHRMVPAMQDGAAVEGRYRMRVPFDIQ